MPDFAGKIVFITGAGSGIGRATALAFAKAGAYVVVTDINEISGQETVAIIEQLGQEAQFLLCDVSLRGSIVGAIGQTIDLFGRLDIGINNAGIGGKYGRLLDQSPGDFEQIMAINVGGVFYGMQAQVQQMVKQGGGQIVNVSSIAGVRGMPFGAPYSASKHAVIGLTKTAALEYAKQNIRINAICPVYTHSSMVDELIQTAPGIEDRMRRMIPMGRLGQPEEIAQAILWLCADENSFVTGQAIQLDGGFTAG
ncbi:SDR family NAD(P)-dependent oxidoreductase [Spirosoma rhododendri]|uniref:Glucose 1-dehydrogenase n=1 Tax=Spirosoma rhododendri TaxID=2728024 RepID=A0A7L5DJ96_9BACT|nr:glucose 1-dehydrogenase [Spirosoma rhododendri]QJD78489.1 glucose 1-dehydrogenase [Spirosoma rhododendri]